MVLIGMHVLRASADCLQIAANAASPWKKLPACALEFTGRVEIWTPTCYLEGTQLWLDEPICIVLIIFKSSLQMQHTSHP